MQVQQKYQQINRDKICFPRASIYSMDFTWLFFVFAYFGQLSQSFVGMQDSPDLGRNSLAHALARIYDYLFPDYSGHTAQSIRIQRNTWIRHSNLLSVLLNYTNDCDYMDSYDTCDNFGFFSTRIYDTA